MLLGTGCVVCGKAGRRPLCQRCAHRLEEPPDALPPPGLDALVCVFAYATLGRDVVAALKFRNDRSMVPLVALVLEPVCRAHDVVTWAPTSPARRRARGYDQAAVLARAIARHAHLPCRDLLHRASGPTQTGRSSVERERGPRFTATRRITGRVLLVDDVVTTGATMAGAAAALRAAGACAVTGAALARTPRRR